MTGDTQAGSMGSWGPSVLQNKSRLECKSAIWKEPGILMKSSRLCINLVETGPLAVIFPLKWDYRSLKMELLSYIFYVMWQVGLTNLILLSILWFFMSCVLLVTLTSEAGRRFFKNISYDSPAQQDCHEPMAGLVWWRRVKRKWKRCE